MQYQKRVKKHSKKRSKKPANRDWFHDAYDPKNPLTIYYAKYINKDKKV